AFPRQRYRGTCEESSALPIHPASQGLRGQKGGGSCAASRQLLILAVHSPSKKNSEDLASGHLECCGEPRPLAEARERRLAFRSSPDRASDCHRSGVSSQE